ncbi:MAG: hypothetical protein KDH15_15225 [Rhodocyclaceae bacterium]|nr:hypothetical protein [Rhodocyclaceae bacterium]
MNSSNVTLPTSLSEHLLNFGRHFAYRGEMNGEADRLPEHEQLKNWAEPRMPKRDEESKFIDPRSRHPLDAGTRLVTAGPLDKADSQPITCVCRASSRNCASRTPTAASAGA